jgi:hypothetical protein
MSGPVLAGGFGQARGFVRSLGPVAWYQRGVGMAVSAWVDQVAGGAQNFVQATATNQPTVTASGSLLFDGADNYMQATFTLAQPYTIYMLFNQVTWTGNDMLLSGATSTSHLRQVTATPQIAFNAGSALATVSPVVNTVNVISAVGNGASSVVQLNNDAPVTGNAGTNAFSDPFLASSAVPGSFANGDYYELIFFGAAHDAATRARVIRYLSMVGQLGI